MKKMSATGHKRTSHPIRSSRSNGVARQPLVERTERRQNIKRLAEPVLSQKAIPYMLQSGTEAANWIRSQGSQIGPRVTDTINLSRFARKIFSAPSSSRGT